MTSLEAYAAARAREAAVDPDDAVTWLWDEVQHQGTPKRTGYEWLSELVALDGGSDLWRLIGILCGNAREDDLARSGPAVVDAFAAACTHAQRRLATELDTVADPDQQWYMLTALAALLRDHALFDALEHLGGCELERWCARCGAYFLGVRDRALTFQWRAGRVEVDPASRSSVDRSEIAAAAQRARDPAIARAIGTLLGTIICPRCAFRTPVVGEPARPDGIVRRRASDAGEATIADPDAVEVIVAALLDCFAEDKVRLPGIGALRLKRYAPYRDPGGPRKVLPFFDASRELLSFVQRGEISPRVASHEPSLDRLASAIVDAFAAHDAVRVAGLGVFAIAIRPARPGATVDGAPVLVPHRAVVTFEGDPQFLSRIQGH